MKRVSIVVPVYNEDAVLPLFASELDKVIKRINDYQFEVVFVNDGSTDGTYDLLLGIQKGYPNLHIVLVNLSKNYGDEVALHEGLHASTGKAVIVMDCDLQDPPSLIPEMISKWEEGYEAVNARYVKRKKDGLFSRLGNRMYYKTINRITRGNQIPLNVGNFRLLDRDCVDYILEHPSGIYRIEAAHSTNHIAEIDYVRDERKRGKDHYNTRGMFKIGIESFISVSSSPFQWMFPYAVGFTTVAITALVVQVTLFVLITLYVIMNTALIWFILIFFIALDVILIVGAGVLTALCTATHNIYLDLNREIALKEDDIVTTILRGEKAS